MHCETNSCESIKLLSSLEQYKGGSPSVPSTAVIGIRHSCSPDSVKFKETSALIGCASFIHELQNVPDELHHIQLYVQGVTAPVPVEGHQIR